jgi:hypothetical protein
MVEADGHTTIRRAGTGIKGSFKLAATPRMGMSTALAEEDLTEEERAGLALVRESGGIHQSDFWKELDVNSRKGSRIVESLVEKGFVEREDTVYNGHNTFYVTPPARDRDFSLLLAGNSLSPFIGDDITPQSDSFSQWVMNLAYEEYNDI